MPRYLFVGEQPSATALSRGWTWKDGHLAAKQLFDALNACGIDPHSQRYGNWFEWSVPERCSMMAQARRRGMTVVALGEKVHREMEAFGFPHLRLTHPAARGKIRRKATYAAHVRLILLGDKLEGKP